MIKPYTSWQSDCIDKYDIIIINMCIFFFMITRSVTMCNMFGPFMKSYCNNTFCFRPVLARKTIMSLKAVVSGFGQNEVGELSDK